MSLYKVECFIIPVIVTVCILLNACHSSGISEKETRNVANKKDTFQYRETLVDPSKSSLINLTGFKRVDNREVLSQRWQLLDPDDASTDNLMFLNGNGDRIYQDIILFKDSSAVYNPRQEFHTGMWSIYGAGKSMKLQLHFNNLIKRQYNVSFLTSREMKLNWMEGKDSLWMIMRSDGKVHEDMRSDPWYPSNMKWIIKPAMPESDSLIKERVRACIRFYALFYRDHIKRVSSTINFAGLPDVFIWYNGGIGLPERDKVEDSWINCFYNNEQALQGYDLLKALIIDNEFNWPRKTPNWFYRTHSVLEQMYHKL